MTHTTNQAIAGLHLRHDIPTKCRIVEHVLTHKYTNKQSFVNTVRRLALIYNVNPLTIKLWCSRYATTYKQGLTLPAGTMSFCFTPIPHAKVTEVSDELAKLRSSLGKLKSKYHPDTAVSTQTLFTNLFS